ncbi:hypothetical protein FACS189451_02650 [Bacteroidia bacterium]|nr:hypothetical protein FACS189446_4510 [Bacteroidia bacterium]GHT61171.1 hypothetical protein FACS189451_02650 [Bacteroidia bacterium]
MMKKIGWLSVLASLLMACDYTYTEKVSYEINEPVFMSETAFRNSVKVTSEQREISNYGKICFYNGYLFISESEVGIHILDNRNPAQPHNIGFIELLGNADIAVKDNKLYADSYIDLVWFDISDPANPKPEGRLENAFPEALPVVVNGYGYDYSMVYDDNGKKKSGIVVGWALKQRVEDVERRTGGWWGWGMEDGAYANVASKGNSMSSGVNGSMSRFTLYDKYLYAVVGNQMEIFDLQSSKPQKVFSDYLPYLSEVETIFSYKDKMFLGMPSGMAIYSVENPILPTYCSLIVHAYGCDPVVVDNDLAYITVRSGNFCGQTINELFVVDVADVYHPKQIVSYTMTHPKGLGIDNGLLFLCDDGLKVFKIGAPQTLMSNQILHKKGMDGYDLIPYENVLMMIADDGLYQYDYSDLNTIKELSMIPVRKK